MSLFGVLNISSSSEIISLKINYFTLNIAVNIKCYPTYFRIIMVAKIV